MRHGVEQAVPQFRRDPDPVVQASAQPPGPARRSRRRRSPAALLVALIAFAGIALVELPGAANWISQKISSQEIVGLSDMARTIEPASREEVLAAARAYNSGLTGAAVVGAGANVPTFDGGGGAGDGDEADDPYERLLAADPTGLMARIRVPSIGVDLPIYHGTADSTLERGVGHLKGTALPVGGEGTHTVLTAHRGLAKAELFSSLDRVEPGDTFTIEVFGEVLTYRVTETRVVEPDETESLFPRQGMDLATLVTCTPLGVNTHRILVTGERVTPTPVADLDAAGGDPTVPGFPWWAVRLGGAALIIGAYAVVGSRPASSGQTRRSST